MAFGVPLNMAGAQVASAVPSNFGPLAQAMNTPTLQNKPKINWLGVLADALAGAAGRPGPYAAMLDQQHQLDQEDQRYERHKTDSFDLWRQEQDYQREHQQPDITPFGRELIESGLQPGTPEYTKRMSDHLNAVDDPIVTVPLPGNRIYSGPRSGLATALSSGSAALPPTAPVGPLTPIGGQTPRASGNFPRHNRAK
jgi:hypothetical protein